MEEIEIDVVIPWLNPTEKWFNEYKQFCENENPARIRDLNTIRPTIKSIIKNLSWVRYIWIIVFDEEQIPDWEEFKNEKIKFVFHRDIIPKEFLPTFNSLIPEMFVHNIKDLSENFIWSNDDMIFLKPIPKEFYFKNGKTVHRSNIKRIWHKETVNMFSKIRNNTAKFISKFNEGKNFLAEDYHLPIPLKKSLCEFIWNKHYKELYESCKNSKIRKETNFSMAFIPFSIEEIYNLCEYEKYPEIKCKVIHFTDNITKQELEKSIKDNHIICLNDSEGLVKKADDVAQYIKELL